MKDKWKKPYTSKAKKAKKSTKGKSKGKSMKYADVKSFKLSCTESTWVSVTGGVAPYVTTTGPTVAIGNQTVTGSGGSLVRFGGACQFTLGYTNQYSQLRTLFDRYRINGVKLRFIPQFNIAPVGITTIPVIKFARDYDDNLIPNVGDIWARQGPEYRFNKPVTIFVRPRILESVYVSGANTTVPGATVKMPYLNMSYAGQIPGYGLKFAVKDWPSGAATGANCICRIEATYYVTFREQINVGLTDHVSGETEVLDNADGVQEDVPCELRPPPK